MKSYSVAKGRGACILGNLFDCKGAEAHKCAFNTVLSSKFGTWGQVNVEQYGEWIQLVAELTVSSLNSWAWAAASVYYLLGLWSRLVSSMPYLKGESPSLLETYVPKITEAYLTSRCGAGCSMAAVHVSAGNTQHFT